MKKINKAISDTFIDILNLILIIVILTLSVWAIWNRFYILNILIVILEIISIPIGKEHQRRIEISVFDEKKLEMKDVLQNMRPDKKFSSIQNSRNELRFGLQILTVVAIIISLYLTVLSKNIWGFLTSIAVIWIAFIYADYIPHASYYSKYYDSIFTGNIKEAKSSRGLARIYKEEYEKTNGFKNKELYDTYGEYTVETDCKTQDECIKSILFLKADSLYYPVILYSVIILFFNIILAIPNVFEISVKSILTDLKFDYALVQSLIVLAFNIVFALLNLWSVTHHYKICEIIKSISISLKDHSTSKDRIEEYNRLRNKNKRSFEEIRARGVFVYCSTVIDENKTLDTINIKYRMLFIHRFYANKSRFWMTFWFSLLALFCTIMTWDIDWTIGIILLAIFVVLALLFYFLWLPKLGKHKIVKNIKDLQKQKT